MKLQSGLERLRGQFSPCSLACARLKCWNYKFSFIKFSFYAKDLILSASSRRSLPSALLQPMCKVISLSAQQQGSLAIRNNSKKMYVVRNQFANISNWVFQFSPYVHNNIVKSAACGKIDAIRFSLWSGAFHNEASDVRLDGRLCVCRLALEHTRSDDISRRPKKHSHDVSNWGIQMNLLQTRARGAV